jgi:hypothetical protein
MPEFMDVHEGMVGITHDTLMQAHQADLDIQDDEGVNFKHTWGRPGVRDGLVPVGGAERGGREEDPSADRSSSRGGLPGPGPGLIRREDPLRAGVDTPGPDAPLLAEAGNRLTVMASAARAGSDLIGRLARIGSLPTTLRMRRSRSRRSS